METRKATVLVCDDHALLAEGIAGLLRPIYEVVAICLNGRKLLERALQLRPDLVTFDIGMPEMNGLEAARKLTDLLPRTRTICVTQQVDLQYLAAALRAGARGFVAKQSAYTELLDAVRTVEIGRIFITPSLRGAYTEFVRADRAQVPDTVSVLTSRQREVLQLIAEGKATKEIASALGISGKTVEFHREGIARVTGLRSIADLTRYALRHQMTHL